MMTTTSAMTTISTTTSTTTTTTTTASTTQGGNKCHTGQCNGTTCYENFNTIKVCTSSEAYCQLKKDPSGTSVQWTAGCSGDCSNEKQCAAGTDPPCHLECCNATVTSCLNLDGKLNMPTTSFATRGPQQQMCVAARLGTGWVRGGSAEEKVRQHIWFEGNKNVALRSVSSTVHLTHVAL
ncbi:hypothetical protein WMY93_026884 [Mugilogobius chulae]|uniref:Uncharacterized protein n=1 Tax=Mugilogobius chulae TaxID=88201 RepID=A0AAW0N8U6_9GOBI